MAHHGHHQNTAGGSPREFPPFDVGGGAFFSEQVAKNAFPSSLMSESRKVKEPSSSIFSAASCRCDVSCAHSSRHRRPSPLPKDLNAEFPVVKFASEGTNVRGFFGQQIHARKAGLNFHQSAERHEDGAPKSRGSLPGGARMSFCRTKKLAYVQASKPDPLKALFSTPNR